MRDLPNSPACVALVAELFPGLARDLPRLAESSETFLSLCEDYELAVDALRKLESRNRPEDVERMIEYRRLIADLERELSEALKTGI